MNSILLFENFYSSLSWNGLLYAVNKSFSVIRTMFLYHYLSTQDFSLWANSNSMIFLLLLWLDCGLRKSIPRYAVQMGSYRYRYLTRIIFFYLIVLVLGLPILYYTVSHITSNTTLLKLVSCIYIVEGVHVTIRLMYHAFFYNKTFNLMAITATTIEMSIVLAIGGWGIPDSATLLLITFTTKICITIALIIASAWQFKHQPQPIVSKHTFYKGSFIKHSGAMWGTAVLNSLTERNVVIPILTAFMGQEIANICKLAQDGALYFYRIIIKTFGASDTALLAHIQEGYEDRSKQKKAIEDAIKKLTTQITRLVLPLLGVIGVIMYSSYRFKYNQYVFHAFFIMSVGYLAEIIWLPYERLLEVKQSYRALLVSYIPYLCGIVILLYLLYISCIGLLPFLLLLHGVRLVTGFIMRIQAYKKFHV